MKFPATKTCHWATGPVDACDEHARQIVNLGAFLGAHVAVTKLEKPSECQNCINEAKTE